MHQPPRGFGADRVGEQQAEAVSIRVDRAHRAGRAGVAVGSKYSADIKTAGLWWGRDGTRTSRPLRALVKHAKLNSVDVTRADSQIRRFGFLPSVDMSAPSKAWERGMR